MIMRGSLLEKQGGIAGGGGGGPEGIGRPHTPHQTPEGQPEAKFDALTF